MKKYLIGCLIVVIVLGVAYWKITQVPASQPPTVIVTRRNITEKVVAVGSIAPLHAITIKSQSAGTVETLLHEQGDYVHKGDVLLYIKPKTTPEQYANALALVKQDEADVTALTQQLHNYQSLREQHIVTKQYQPLILTEGELAHARAKLEYDQQSLELLTQGSTTVGGKIIENSITSPIDGYILERAVDVGDPVISLASNQAATVLFTMANMDDLLFKGSVDEIDAAKLTPGLPASIQVAALPDVPITGKLTQLSLQALSSSDSVLKNTSPFNVGFYIEVSSLTLPPETKLRSGYSATATIVIKAANNVLSIPESAIFFKAGRPYVRMPSKDKEPPTERAIEMGLSDAIYLEVKQGLQEGDIILQQPVSDE